MRNATSTPVRKGHCEALVLGETDYGVRAVAPGDVSRVVGGAVIDDQPQHLVEAVDLAWQVSQGLTESLGLVEARDLDDQAHRPIVSG